MQWFLSGTYRRGFAGGFIYSRWPVSAAVRGCGVGGGWGWRHA